MLKEFGTLQTLMKNRIAFVIISQNFSFATCQGQMWTLVIKASKDNINRYKDYYYSSSGKVYQIRDMKRNEILECRKLRSLGAIRDRTITDGELTGTAYTPTFTPAINQCSIIQEKHKKIKKYALC